MLLDDYFLRFTQQFKHSIECADLPLETQGCANFWISCYLVVIFVFALVFLYAVRNILRERAEFNAYQKRKIERAKVADAETMKQVQWQTNDEYDDIDYSELAEKMRQQIIKANIK